MGVVGRFGPAGAVSSPWLWFASRAGGVVALLLLTSVVVLGAVTAADRPLPTASAGWVAGLHRYLTVGLAVLLVVHIGAAVIDTYVDLAWRSIFLPLTAGYRRTWVAVGTVALDAVLIVGITSWLRPRLSHRVWRSLHWASYAAAAAAVVHALTMASADQPGFRAITIACGAAMATAVVWRVCSRSPDRRRRAAAAAGEWA